MKRFIFFILIVLFSQRAFCQALNTDSILIIGPNETLPTNALLVDSIVTKSTKQMYGVGSNEYYSIVLNKAKQMAAKKGGNLIQVTHYHSFSIIPFGAYLRSKVYQLNQKDYNSFVIHQKEIAALDQVNLQGKCVVHLKNYSYDKVDLFFNDSLIFKLPVKNPKGDSIKRNFYKHEYVFTFNSGGVLKGRSFFYQTLPLGSIELKSGCEYFLICEATKKRWPRQYRIRFYKPDKATFYHDY